MSLAADPLARASILDDTIPAEIEKIAQILKTAKNAVVLSGTGLNFSAGLPEMEVPEDTNPLHSRSTKPLSLLREQASPTTAYMAISELFKKGFQKSSFNSLFF